MTTPPSAAIIRKTKWIFPKLDAARERALADALGILPLTARVLLSRGYGDQGDARQFLETPLSGLHDPYLLSGMAEAVPRLLLAIARRESILIYGDYDVDGTTSIVILKKAIEMAGGIARYHVPHRLIEGYGMRAEVIEEAAASGVTLVISVDTGIRAQEVVSVARARGMDVIVTDHHIPEAELPPALAVLNPNRADCAYPEKNLCGAGVAFKLVQALLGTLGWPAAKLQRVLESFLKLVAVATVADVVPLVGENRIIVKHGLAGLDDVKNPGLRALLDTAGFEAGKRPTATEVAFRVAPRINAAGRMANARDVIRMFLTSDAAEARTIAGALHALNQERQQTEADIVRAVLDECVRKPVGDDQMALVFSGADWHRGVVGIVASRLVERFSRPVFVLSQDSASGEAAGSGRSIKAFHLLDALESMPDLFRKFGGHKQAAGLTLAAARVDEFRERLSAYAATRLQASDLRPQLDIDATLRLDEINDAGVAEILSLAPFGCGNSMPVFAVLEVELAAAPKIVKEKHARLTLRQNGRAISAMGWNMAERASTLEVGARMDAAISVQSDEYARSRGWGDWSVLLKDVRLCENAFPSQDGKLKKPA